MKLYLQKKNVNKAVKLLPSDLVIVYLDVDVQTALKRAEKRGGKTFSKTLYRKHQKGLEALLDTEQTIIVNGANGIKRTEKLVCDAIKRCV